AEFAGRPEQRRVAATDLDVLTEREREVMALVAAGRTNDEIAAELFISPATAKTHVSRAMSKLGARDRAQLVVLAYETGLITPRARSISCSPAEAGRTTRAPTRPLRTGSAPA